MGEMRDKFIKDTTSAVECKVEMNDRFVLREGCIVDELTGFKYSKLGELCKLLNQVNSRADKNAILYYDLLR